MTDRPKIDVVRQSAFLDYPGCKPWQVRVAPRYTVASSHRTLKEAEAAAAKLAAS